MNPLPCPFCGGVNVIEYQGGAWLGCRTCGADGPERARMTEYTWNTRAPGPLLAHGYRPEHGDPVVWAAELLDVVTTGASASNEEVFRLMEEGEDLRRQLTEARNDIAALKASNDTLVSLVTRFREEAFRPRRGFLSRFFGGR